MRIASRSIPFLVVDMDLYEPLLGKVLFPAFEAARGRPTVSLRNQLERTQWWSSKRLRELQTGYLRRLVRHAFDHTEYYRDELEERRLRPEQIDDLSALRALPVLDRATVRATLGSRTATVPAVAVRKTTSGTSGQPVTVKYGSESRHWRDATRLRGYGWAGYEIGMRAFHFWGQPPQRTTWFQRTKEQLDRWLKRDLYVDCTPRHDDALARAIASLEDHRSDVIVAYATGAATLARFVNERGLRTWRDIPVLACAERLWRHDRDVIEQTFGPAFETYGCREMMLIGSECERHDGLHTSMENLIVELIVREQDGTFREARPGETGEVAITDLHNLSCPMIRYLTGDLAVARTDDRCPCGRGLVRIGPIEGRVTHALRDRQGRMISGLVFNVLFATIGELARSFQVVQRTDRSVVLKIVPMSGSALSQRDDRTIRDYAQKYLRDTRFSIELVSEIPLTAAGKREIVVIESDEPPHTERACDKGSDCSERSHQ